MCQSVTHACLQGGALYQNNCVSNNIKNSVFNGNKAQQGSGIYLNNSLPVRTRPRMRENSNICRAHKEVREEGSTAHVAH